MEQGHIPSIDTMDGITEIFALLSTTLLLNVIDCHQYIKISIPLSLHEQEEIKLAQLEAQMLVEFLSQNTNFVEDGTSKLVSVQSAFVTYFSLQGRWLLWQLRCNSQGKQDEVHCKLVTVLFLKGDDIHQLFTDEEVWKEWPVEEPDCIIPVSQALGIGFPCDKQNYMKQKSIRNSKKQPSKWQRVDGNFE